jgi:hypothetical protein
VLALFARSSTHYGAWAVLADLPLLVCIGPTLPVAFQTLLGTDDPALIEEAISLYRAV